MTSLREASGRRPADAAGWFPLLLAAAALLSLIALTLVIRADRLRWLVPAGDQFQGPRTLESYALQMIELITGSAFLAGLAAVVLSILQLRRGRTQPDERRRVISLIALALGLVALPAAVGVLVVGVVASTPWSFG
jgi:hypothetical protein